MSRYNIEKPWGVENVLEINDKYMMKLLEMKAGHQCSLQLHEQKHETFYVISGHMEFDIENADGVMVTMQAHPGFSFTIHPGIKHRMRAITDIAYMEASTSHPDDVVRFEDNYGRIDSN